MQYWALTTEGIVVAEGRTLEECQENCPTDKGILHYTAKVPPECGMCHGTGKIPDYENSWTCSSCGGTGYGSSWD